MVASSSILLSEQEPPIQAAAFTGSLKGKAKKRDRNSFNRNLDGCDESQNQGPVAKSARTERNGTEETTECRPNATSPDAALRQSLSVLYSPSVCAKIWGVAKRALDYSLPPTLYPEYTKPGMSEYIYREGDFWTSGFFPGSLYLLLERQRKYSHLLQPSPSSGLPQLPHSLQLEKACKWWTVNLHKNSVLEGTHDLGFMICPWALKAWELDHDTKAYDTLISAANTLASRFDERVGAIRSWDVCVTKRYSFTDPMKDFLVIIDNMLNLDLLFWAARELRSDKMRSLAISHAKVSQKYHIRRDNTTFHVVNFDQNTGQPKEFLTNQGFSDQSCWSRGQAWAITGFAQTYHWTHDLSFLESARRCADYFVKHLPAHGVPYWDFDVVPTEDTPTDTSAAMIAAYGMLLIHEALVALGLASPYLKSALHIVQSVSATKLSPSATFNTSAIRIPSVNAGYREESGPLEVNMGDGPETILLGATINNYEFAPRRWANHGLVYADYFFLLIGNKLLEMGIGGDTGTSLP